MAERSGPSRIVALVLVGLGAFLLVAAILIPTYTISRLEKIPLDLEVTTVSTGSGSVLDAASLTSGDPQIDEDVPFVSQRYVTVEEPSNGEIVTLQAGTTLRRTDMQGETGLRSATVDRVTIDRKTAMPVQDPIGSIQVQGDAPAEEVEHTGLQYKFPFDAQQESYPYFDINARESQPIDFVEETEINGTPVYMYRQTVGPVDLSEVSTSAANRVTLPAEAWGVEGGEEPVTMSRFYENERTLWVEPETGVIVKGDEQLLQYYSRTAGEPEVTVVDVPLTFDENTVEFQLDVAKDAQDTLSLFGRTIPIIAGILGVIALIAGIVLGLRGDRGNNRPARRTEPNRPDDGGDGSAARTEPRHRDWTTDQTEVIPRTNLSKE